MLFIFENIAVYNLVIGVILVTTDTLNIITDKSFFYVNKVEKIKSVKNYFVILPTQGEKTEYQVGIKYKMEKNVFQVLKKNQIYMDHI